MGPPPVPRNPAAGERFTPPVSGPSFLGLGDDRSPDLDYLLDDEPARGHGRLYLALLLLLVSAGLLAWHWQRDGYPWTAIIQRQRANSAAASSTPPPAPNPGTSAESTTPPATANAQPPTGTEKSEASQLPLITASPTANMPALADGTPPSAASPTATSSIRGSRSHAHRNHPTKLRSRSRMPGIPPRSRQAPRLRNLTRQVREQRSLRHRLKRKMRRMQLNLLLQHRLRLRGRHRWRDLYPSHNRQRP